MTMNIFDRVVLTLLLFGVVLTDFHHGFILNDEISNFSCIFLWSKFGLMWTQRYKKVQVGKEQVQV